MVLVRAPKKWSVHQRKWRRQLTVKLHRWRNIEQYVCLKFGVIGRTISSTDHWEPLPTVRNKRINVFLETEKWDFFWSIGAVYVRNPSWWYQWLVEATLGLTDNKFLYIQYTTRSSATAETVRDAETAIQGQSRSSVVVPIDAAYSFLLELNSNVTSIFNRSWDITSSLHIHTPRFFHIELEKDGWEYALV